MAKDSGTTPARTPATLRKPASVASTGKQSSILGFFSKAASSSTGAAPASSTLQSSPAAAQGTPTPSTVTRKKSSTSASSKQYLKESTKSANSMAAKKRLASNTTPVPSSDAVSPLSSQENLESSVVKALDVKKLAMHSSPSRKGKKTVNYAESSDDEDEDVFTSLKSRPQQRRRRAAVPNGEDDDDGDNYQEEENEADNNDDDDMGDFIASDESDDLDAPSKAKKRKRSATTTKPAPRKRANVSSPSRPGPPPEDDEPMEDVESTSTAQQWKYDPDNVQPSGPGSSTHRQAPKKPSAPKAPAAKAKAHTKEPEDRYPWLANILDGDKRPPGHPDYDPRTIFIPPGAKNKFSPFEKQYWEIKQKLWDTIVFFKKGKFYELYENDATVGHQLFDLKMTDRVNMRMVGVPEGSLDMWVNQFVAKGYKVARVEQMESALGKEMRERDIKTVKAKKEDKIIRRELSCILTGGTLVEGSMLQDDMATYCAAIKEGMVDDKPSFGIAFVDAATGQFFISEFEDDTCLTKFETFVAQISPRELLLEKSHISSKALRILKNNTSPTTIWNYLKPESEFWEADRARRELDCNGYFTSDENGKDEDWPTELEESKGKDLLMSSMGALVQYLRVLKLERTLLSQRNFAWYNPIHRNGTLILDGQTLINLEIFANSVDGSSNGTLFSLLNRCITPFGKRLLRQWVCHPLCDIRKINERLDAVDMLNTDCSIREQFSSQMAKMPDLERLISRIHAGSCRPVDFVRVLEGFEQIEYTMNLLGSFAGGNSLVDKLIASMPKLDEPLGFWKHAFDRRKAREEKLMIPEPGIEEDFDTSQEELMRIRGELGALLDEKKAALNCKTLKFTDVGKEIYQVEVPKKIKVPSSWRQMSATATVKRYYFRELEELVRELQEAEETHSQIVKGVASSFFRRFDTDYDVWLQAIRITAHLDCLVSLAKASSAIGNPSCRPEFVDDERSVVEFKELRHPCMIDSVADFIPNDIKLGGDEAKINLLTGANAAGKSTILRMSCTAVIMAQIGCHVPALSARLTPVDRIMSRLGANDNIFAAQSTFFVELSETQKILAEATLRSLVILDELGRGTSSYDGLAVAQAVLHQIATHVGCIGFFATHYHSLAAEFVGDGEAGSSGGKSPQHQHPEIRARRMRIDVDEAARRVTFLYQLEDGVAEGSFGMHCASMCGVPERVVRQAEEAAARWEHTSRLKESLDRAREARHTGACYLPLGLLSDVASLLRDGKGEDGRPEVGARGLDVLVRAIEGL